MQDQKKSLEMSEFGSNQAQKKIPYDAKLYKLVPRVDLRNVDFSMCSPDLFSNVDLTGADLSGAVFGNANFYNSTLSEVNLEGAVFNGTRFDDSTLIGANFDRASLNRVDFIGSKLSNATFRSATINNKKDELCWDSSDFRHVDFSDAKISGGKLLDLQLDEAIFVRSNIENVWFSKSSRENSKFSMEKANFQNAQLNTVHFSDVSANYSNFSSISGSNLTFDVDTTGDPLENRLLKIQILSAQK